MVKLFKQYPDIVYNSVTMKNIMVRFGLVDQVLSVADVFYPYVIDDTDRLDTLAYDYYGSPTWGWLILLVNDMNDPYHDWPLNYEEFRSNLLRKNAGMTISGLQSQIHHYEYTGLPGGGDTEDEIARISWWMTPESYALSAALNPTSVSGWTSVSTYDYEWSRNEDKRAITLLGKQFLPQVNRELKKIFSGERLNISRKVIYA